MAAGFRRCYGCRCAGRLDGRLPAAVPPRTGRSHVPEMGAAAGSDLKRQGGSLAGPSQDVMVGSVKGGWTAGTCDRLRLCTDVIHYR